MRVPAIVTKFFIGLTVRGKRSVRSKIEHHNYLKQFGHILYASMYIIRYLREAWNKKKAKKRNKIVLTWAENVFKSKSK